MDVLCKLLLELTASGCCRCQWGRGLWGQTGHGTNEDILSPRQVQGLEGKVVLQASAGARHTVVLLDEGEVFGWGDCAQGQLGISYRCDFFPSYAYYISASIGSRESF